ncbi:hypothetical protein VNI00_001513 [Paramarasmius palmivorus]|uniref:Zn(2)-C6 fungal-type domain-containing protein n=1 Tax=Paramarasmius palmivorus TaxID=297713 RepID=A0AAW0E7A1_9AGAR
MPKSTTASTSRPALRRNQACRSCRKRKLKCDAQRPHCGTCVKQWHALISVPAPIGYAHPTEPQCSYDPVEGLTLAPDTDPVEKIKQLEEQISTLKNKLFEVQAASASRSGTPSQSTSILPAPSTEIGGISLPHASLSMTNSLSPSNSDIQFRSESGSPELRTATSTKSGADPFMDLLFLGWNPDLPDPATLNH